MAWMGDHSPYNTMDLIYSSIPKFSQWFSKNGHCGFRGKYQQLTTGSVHDENLIEISRLVIRARDCVSECPWGFLIWWFLGSTVIQTLVNFHSNWKTTNTNLIATCLWHLTTSSWPRPRLCDSSLTKQTLRVMITFSSVHCEKLIFGSHRIYKYNVFRYCVIRYVLHVVHKRLVFTFML